MPECPNGCDSTPVLVSEKYIQHDGYYKTYYCDVCCRHFDEAVTTNVPRDAFYGSSAKRREEQKTLEKLVSDSRDSL